MFYILDEFHNPVKVDIIEFTNWFETADRQIANYLNGGVLISTVFLGVNHGFGGKPKLFETMIFGGEFDGHQQRYFTWEMAEKGHELIVAAVSIPKIELKELPVILN